MFRSILLMLLPTVLLCSALPAFSSEEEALIWQSVVVRCREVPAAGMVSCEIDVDGRNYRKLLIQAFGKAFTIGADDLIKLEGYPLSSLTMTHEVGYAEIGGPTVHLRWKRTRFSKMDGPITEEILISVTSTGVLVTGPRQLESAGD